MSRTLFLTRRRLVRARRARLQREPGSESDRRDAAGRDPARCAGAASSALEGGPDHRRGHDGGVVAGAHRSRSELVRGPGRRGLVPKPLGAEIEEEAFAPGLVATRCRRMPGRPGRLRRSRAADSPARDDWPTAAAEVNADDIEACVAAAVRRRRAVTHPRRACSTRRANDPRKDSRVDAGERARSMLPKLEGAPRRARRRR